MQRNLRWLLCGLLLLLTPTLGSAQEVQSLLLKIKTVGKEGAGNVEASKAWKELVALGPGVVPDVLSGMNDANPIAVNWLRTAVEAIHDKPHPTKMPVAKIEAFLNDTKNAGHSRRLAYECLVKLDPNTPNRYLPKMLDDPSAELRRDAVQRKLDHGKVAAFESRDSQQKFYESLLKSARDRDQVDAVCKVLKEEFQIDVDLTKHYGFVTRWLLIGSFDNRKGVGFNTVYPPERGFEIKAVYPAKDDGQARWREHVTAKPLGLVDLNEVVGKHKGAVVYGYAAVESASERPVDIRAASNNAVRMWLNGKEIYFREEYHHGMAMDQHTGKGVLKAGRNEILIKVCQNEQTDSWAQLWSFQVRVCDYLGAAVPVTNVTERIK
ncbi:MAG: hypothetical protein HYR84_01885 [Planctomycetes bacterium]|nr:hypothetical protein [Planctomycetota bacterium]